MDKTKKPANETGTTENQPAFSEPTDYIDLKLAQEYLEIAHQCIVKAMSKLDSIDNSGGK